MEMELERLSPLELMEMFSIDTKCREADDFLRLVYMTAAERALRPQESRLMLVARTLWEEKRQHPRGFLGGMKQLLAPILQAPDELLAALALPLQRRTVTELADILADRVRENAPS